MHKKIQFFIMFGSLCFHSFSSDAGWGDNSSFVTDSDECSFLHSCDTSEDPTKNLLVQGWVSSDVRDGRMEQKLVVVNERMTVSDILRAIGKDGSWEMVIPHRDEKGIDASVVWEGVPYSSYNKPLSDDQQLYIFMRDPSRGGSSFVEVRKK